MAPHPTTLQQPSRPDRLHFPCNVLGVPHSRRIRCRQLRAVKLPARPVSGSGVTLDFGKAACGTHRALLDAHAKALPVCMVESRADMPARTLRKRPVSVRKLSIPLPSTLKTRRTAMTACNLTDLAKVPDGRCPWSVKLKGAKFQGISQETGYSHR
jgi:hypothetical protein